MESLYIWVAFNSPKGSWPHLLAGEEDLPSRRSLPLHCVIRVSHGPSKTCPEPVGMGGESATGAGACWTATGWLQLLANPAAGRGTQLGAGPAGEMANQGKRGGHRWRHRACPGYVTAFSLLFLAQTCSSLDRSRDVAAGAGKAMHRPTFSCFFLRDIILGNTV